MERVMAEPGSAALKGVIVLAALGAGVGVVGAGGSAWAQGVDTLRSGSVTISAFPPSNTLSLSGAPVAVITTAASGNPITFNGAFAIITTGSIGGGPRFTVTANPPTTTTLPATATLPSPSTPLATPQPVARNPSIVVNPALGVAPFNQRGVTVREGGLVGLVGPSSAGGSVITATLDKVKIGGAEALAVDLAGDGLLKLQVAPSVVDVHGQALSARNGAVALTAGAARAVVDGVTNARGRTAAHSVTNEGGVIVFGGAPSK